MKENKAGIPALCIFRLPNVRCQSLIPAWGKRLKDALNRATPKRKIRREGLALLTVHTCVCVGSANITGWGTAGRMHVLIKHLLCSVTLRNAPSAASHACLPACSFLLV